MDDSTYGNAVCDSKKRLMLVASSPSAQWCQLYMITSWQGHSFRVTGPLWGKSIGQRLILLTKDVELWCFLSYQPEQTYELTFNRQVSWRSFDIIVIRCLWQGFFAQCDLYISSEPDLLALYWFLIWYFSFLCISAWSSRNSLLNIVMI